MSSGVPWFEVLAISPNPGAKAPAFFRIQVQFMTEAGCGDQKLVLFFFFYQLCNIWCFSQHHTASVLLCCLSPQQATNISCLLPKKRKKQEKRKEKGGDSSRNVSVSFSLRFLDREQLRPKGNPYGKALFPVSLILGLILSCKPGIMSAPSYISCFQYSHLMKVPDPKVSETLTLIQLNPAKATCLEKDKEVKRLIADRTSTDKLNQPCPPQEKC